MKRYSGHLSQETAVLSLYTHTHIYICLTWSQIIWQIFDPALEVYYEKVSDWNTGVLRKPAISCFKLWQQRFEK